MVQIDNLGRILDEHPFLKGLDPRFRDLLIGCAANERFEAGDYVLHEGGQADRFYLIRGGQVAVEVHVPGRQPLIVETLQEGDVLGWSWLTPPHRWTFDARAMQLTRAVSLDGACLRRKMVEDPALGYEILRRFVPVMAERLRAARLQMLDLYGPGAGQ